jgi:hypothetical protein
MTISFRASATATSGDVVGPSSIVAGDILVLFNLAASGSTPTAAVPSGFTQLNTVAGTAFLSESCRAVISAKRATGAEASASLSGAMAAGSYGSSKILLVFEADAASITTSTFAGQCSSDGGDPSSQSILASGGNSPLIAVAAYGRFSNVAIASRDFSPAKDGEVQVGGGGGQFDLWLAYKIYNSSPADVSVDLASDGQFGASLLQSGWITAVPPAAKAVPPYRRQTRFFTRRF